MRVVIVGGGDVGRELAATLAREGRNQAVLIEADERRCERLAGELDALVLCGDGANPEMLRKAGVGESDALAAVTGSDAINTVIAMLGRRMGAPKIVVKLNEAGLRAACEEMGAVRVVTPKLAAAADVMSALHGFERLDLSLLMLRGARLAELDAGSGRGKRIADLGLPQASLVVGVIRGEETIMPPGRTVLEPGDVLLVLAENDAVLEEVRGILGG